MLAGDIGQPMDKKVILLGQSHPNFNQTHPIMHYPYPYEMYPKSEHVIIAKQQTQNQQAKYHQQQFLLEPFDQLLFQQENVQTEKTQTNFHQQSNDYQELIGLTNVDWNQDTIQQTRNYEAAFPHRVDTSRIIYNKSKQRRLKSFETNQYKRFNHSYNSYLYPTKTKKNEPDQQASEYPARKKRVNIDHKLLQTITILFQQKANNSLMSLQYIASQLQLSYTTVCKLFREWSADSSQLKKKFIQKNTKGKKKIMTSFRVQALQKFIYLNPFLTQNELVEELNKIQEIKSPKGCITRFVVYELIKAAGFVKKKCKRLSSKRNQPQTKRFREYYCKRYNQLFNTTRNNTYFIGQLEINVYTVRGEGWCRADEELVLRCPKAKSQSISSFFIFYKNGTFMSHIKFGPLLKSEIQLLVKKFMQQVSKKYPQRKNYIIIDPSNFQSTLNFQEFKQKLKIQQILFIPPFSPQLSIVQHFFYNFKQRLRVKKLESQAKLKVELQKIVKEDQSKNFTSFYERTLHYVQMGMENRDF